MWDLFISKAFQTALRYDGDPHRQFAMSSKASNPNYIKSKFDEISYSKGEEHTAG